MDTTVVPVLREGLKALNLARPNDPLQFLADFLLLHRAVAVAAPPSAQPGQQSVQHPPKQLPTVVGLTAQQA
jgi:hypothetical protein